MEIKIVFNHFFYCELKYTEKGIKQMHNFMNHFKEKTVITIQQVKRYPHPAISQWQPLPHPRGNLASFVWKSLPFFSVVLSYKYKSLNSIVSFCPFFAFMQSDLLNLFLGGISIIYVSIYNIIFMYIYWMSEPLKFYIHIHICI